tara:strand:+ start:3203 stop:3457 length:255 start_codon:yes stop_codon:yes gene_type:complete
MLLRPSLLELREILVRYISKIKSGLPSDSSKVPQDIPDLFGKLVLEWSILTSIAKELLVFRQERAYFTCEAEQRDGVCQKVILG